jgi:hypothetical protein
VSPCGEGEALSYWSQSYPPSLARIKKRIKERIRVFVFIGENGLKGVSDPVGGVSQTPWGGCLRPRAVAFSMVG